MAEYAGLEIRIGGNTTKLTNALKAPTKSAAELQRQIRQATRAMQFDPTALKNVDTRIRLTGNRMESLQSKAQLVKTAMKQLGDTMTGVFDEKGEPKSVRRIAEETQNLSLKAKQADERFNNLTGTLAQIYEAWNKVSRGKGEDFLTDKLGISGDVAEKLMSTKTSVRELVTELRELQEQRADPTFGGFGNLISDKNIKNVMQLKELNFHDMFKRGLDLDDVLADAKKLGIVLEDSAIANVRELQEVFKSAQAEKKAFDDALKFDKMGTDLERIESEAESLSQTMRTLDDSLNEVSKSEPFQEYESEIRRIDAAIDKLDGDLQRTGDAMKVDPNNIQLAARYFDDLQQKTALAEEKAESLGKQMELFDASGANKAAKGHEDLAKWIEESAESARIANKELSDQRATVANLDDQTKSLAQTIKTMKGDSTLAEYSDNVLNWKKSIEQLSEATDKLRSKNEALDKQQKNVNEAQTAYDNATAKAKEYEGQLESLKSEYKELEAAMEAAFENGQYDPQMDSYVSALKGEIEQLEVAYKGAAQEAKELERPLRSQKKLYDSMSGDVKKATEEVSRLQGKVDELAKTRDVRIFQNPTDEIEKAENELVQLQGELEKAKAKENELETAYDAAKTENELAKTAQAAREVSQEANETHASLRKLSDETDLSKGSMLNPSTLKSIGMTMSATVTPALAAAGYKMVDASSAIDTAYRDMRKTVDGTEEQFEHLRTAAIEFSRTHVTSADQILQIEAIGGELGIATENLETFAEVISNIDVATNLDVEGAADALGHLANILHLTESDYVGFSDALVRLGNNGASTETEIANIAERIGSMGAIVGMSGSDVLAWASSLASTGQNAEAAATALSKTWSFMETSVAAAGGTIDTSFEAINAAVEEGGDKLTIFANLSGMTAEEFAESWETNSEDMAATLNDSLGKAKDNLQLIADVAHMSAEDFARAWESDPTEAAKAFISGLNDIEKSGGSADKVLQSLGITAVRQKQGIEGLMQTIGGLDDNLKMSEDAWNGVSDRWGAAGDAANEAAKKAEGFSGQMQIMKNMAQDFFAELGEGAVPYIKTLTSMLEWATESFSNLSDGMKTFIVGIGGLAAAAGPLLSITATFMNAKKEVKEWADTAFGGMNLVKMAYKQGGAELVESLAGAGSAMTKVKVVATSLGTSLLKVLAFGAVAAGVAVLIAVLKELYDEYQDHIAATEGLSNALASIGDTAEATAEEMSTVAGSVNELAQYADDYESRLADLAQTIEDSNKQYGTFAGQMEYYADTIGNLGGKSDLTTDEAYKLEAALTAVNEACGTTYALDEYGNIIDTETGKIQENTDTILANIDARKQQALVEYYSDDFTKAVGENADAQEKLNELTQEYNKLVSDAGHADFIENQKAKLGNNVSLADIEVQYQQAIDRSKRAMEEYKTEADRTQEVVDSLGAKISSAEEAQRKANETVREAALAQEEYDRRTETVTADVTGNMKRLSDAVTELGGEDSGFNEISSTLDAISVSASELNDVDMGALAKSFDDMGGSMDDVIAALESGGVQMNTWNEALAQAPGAAENMGSVTASAFQSMYEVAGQNINDTMTLIAGLDVVQVGDKTFYVGDNGSIIDEQGQIYDLQGDLSNIPPEVLTILRLDDSESQEKTLKVDAKLKAVGNQHPKPTISVNDQASSKADTIQNKLGTIGSSRPTPTVSVNDQASGTLDAIKRNADSLNGKHSTITVTTVERKVKQATGGMNNRPVIPRHASGYIATGPTMTNQGWIGEDGIEAVVNWATGGAVVPLTNKKYMLPIADAIAEGMSRRIGDTKQVPNVNIYVNGTSDPETVAGVVADRLRLIFDAR